jgi:hypothetical protein
MIPEPGNDRYSMQGGLSMEIFKIVTIGLMIAFASILTVLYYWRNYKINHYGIDTDAVLSKIEEQTWNSPGHPVSRFYYVTFSNKDGTECEARLLEPILPLEKGDIVRIRYIPGKEYYALMLSATAP